MFMPQRFQISQRGETPQGVDLNLDKFGLSTIERFNGCLPPCSASFADLEGRVTLGRAFLKCMQEDSDSLLRDEDQALLRKVFNPAMCDRAEEGEAFIPPEPHHDYLTKVRNVVKQEESLTTRRKSAFFSAGFSEGNAGPDFPRSWTSRVQIQHLGKSSAVSARAGLTRLEVDSMFRKSFATDIALQVTPDFKEATEDGTVFRIYRIGSLEVRTVQESSKEEVVGAVFSRSTPTWRSADDSKSDKALQDGEKPVKGKLYVESVGARSGEENPAGDCLEMSHYYVVLETNHANMVVMEKDQDGSVSWEVNPKSLEDRLSLSKLVKQRDCNTQVAVCQLQRLQGYRQAKEGSFTDQKRYVNAIMQELYDSSLPLQNISKPIGAQGL